MRLAGKTAVVSGGASGLGAATTRRFIAAGARVAILDLNAPLGSALAAEAGGSAVFIETDVTDETSAERAMTIAGQALGGPHVCVCCAGIGGMIPTATPEGAHPLSDFRRLIEVNLIGVFNIARLAAAAMIHNEPDPETGERGVIVMTSIAATDGRIGTAAYSAGKAGVIGMTLPMARDLSEHAIRVMAIAPGLFDTPLLLDTGLPAEVLQAFYRMNEFPKRGGDPDEFAGLVQHIVQNPYLNAETIRIDAGIRGA